MLSRALGWTIAIERSEPFEIVILGAPEPILNLCQTDQVVIALVNASNREVA